MIFTNILQKMLKQDLTCQIVKQLNRFLGKNEVVIGLMKDELGGQIMKIFFGLTAKTYSHLKDNHDEDRKNKRHKKLFHKKRKFQYYKKCLEAPQVEEK